MSLHLDAHRALRLIVESPGELDAATVGALLWPLALPPLGPVRFSPTTSAATAALLCARSRERAEAGAARDARASRLLGRLQERGLLAPCRPPFVVDPRWTPEAEVVRELLTGDVEPTAGEVWAVVAMLRRIDGVAGAREVQQPWRAGDVPDAVALFEDIPTPRTIYQLLVDVEAVCPPSRRWPTEAGIAAVAMWEAA